MAQHKYLHERLALYGISPEMNTFQVPLNPNQPENELQRIHHFFAGDEHDNIIIHYYNLAGYTYHFRREGNKWPIPYTRTRLKAPIVEKEGGEIKYLSPRDSGTFPFFTPGIIDKYRRREKIPLLHVVEGEFKAFAGWMRGVDIIGIPSIHGFYSSQPDRKRLLHEDIEEIVRACAVEKIVYLTDADTLTIHYEEGKDLYKRPNTFYSAVKIFREAADQLIGREGFCLKDVFFAHIRAEYLPATKGLDDLFINEGRRKEDLILADLRELSFARVYFSCQNITDTNLVKLREYFGITDENAFYQLYGKYIGSREFSFRKRRYQHDGEKVVYVRHEDADEYMRVGDEYMKVVKIPNKHGELEEMLRKWKVGEINRDYKRFPDFLTQIRKYEAFCNVPDNSETYRREHTRCYNIYHPLRYTCQEGDISSTVGFLKHLFGGEGWVNVSQDVKTKEYSYMECAALGDPFTVALDYLTIMLRHPTHILPVPCLVSPENNTGKSTFLKWLKDVYGANATILGNEQFKMSFNSHYITKFIIGIDEGFIDVDKKTEKERLKKLATDDRQFLQFKGMDVQEVDFFGKIIICSNDADRLMKIEDGEIRWFVVKVPKLTREDPDLREKMKGEIPAWLNFLKNRAIIHPKEGRAWFNPQYIVTDQLRRIIATTRNRVEKVVDEFVKDMFFTYQMTTVRIHIPWICEQLNKNGKYRIDQAEVKAYLQDKKKLFPQDPTRYALPVEWVEEANGELSIIWRKFRQRPYVLRPEDWLDADELLSFHKPSADAPVPEFVTDVTENGKSAKNGEEVVWEEPARWL